jgi:hypothetical protein
VLGRAGRRGPVRPDRGALDRASIGAHGKAQNRSEFLRSQPLPRIGQELAQHLPLAFVVEERQTVGTLEARDFEHETRTRLETIDQRAIALIEFLAPSLELNAAGRIELGFGTDGIGHGSNHSFGRCAIAFREAELEAEGKRPNTKTLAS